MSKDRQQTQRGFPRLKSRVAPVAGATQEELNLPAHTFSADYRLPDIPMQDVTQDAFAVNEMGNRWLQILWLLSEKTLARANSAMGRDVHRQSRVLRIHRISQDDTGPRNKALVQEVEISDDVNEWYLRMPSAADAWLIELGIVFGKGKFFSLLHSVPIVISVGRGTSLNTERLLAEAPLLGSLESGSPPPLQVRGTLQLHGSTNPAAQATIDDQQVPVDRRTGQFEWRIPLTNGRMVVPVTVADGGKVQRGLLAVELNFHLLDPEPGDED